MSDTSYLTATERFKLGFLLRCAEEGCTPAEQEQRLKAASWSGIGKILAGTALAPVAIDLAGIAGSYGLGRLAGDTYAQATLPTVQTPEDVRKQELAAAYKLQAERIRKLQQQAQYLK